MKYTSLAAILLAGQAAAQITASNPEVDISTCENLRCDVPAPNGLCDADAVNILGVGIAPEIVKIPNSNANLTLSLVDSDDLGYFVAPYRYAFMTQRLHVGAPSGLDLQEMQPGCALMFQYQAQTFPFLTGLADPNTTQCGDALGAEDFTLYSRFISDFSFDGNETANNSDNDDDDQNTIESTTPRCAALAQYLQYRISQYSLIFGSAYYQNLVKITGGAIAGPGLNTTPIARQYGACQPVVPNNYELFSVLEADQILHLDDVDEGFGGRNGTTPVVTVMYGADGNVAELQVFCMRQFATGNRQLPSQSLKYESGTGSRKASHGSLIAVIALGLSLLFNS